MDEPDDFADICAPGAGVNFPKRAAVDCARAGVRIIAENHPFDGRDDNPFGYGEYAEYRPWADRGDRTCHAARRVWTSREGLAAMPPRSLRKQLEVERPGEAPQKQPRPADHGDGDGEQVRQSRNA